MSETSGQKKMLGASARFWLWILVLLPGIPFIIGSILLLGYANIPLPVDNKVKIDPVEDGTEEVILLVHGKGDTPLSWAQGFADQLRKSVLKDHQQVLTINWSEYSTDLFRCTLNGRRIGRDLGRKLSKNKKIKRFHLIGHSAGSFVVFGLCESIRKESNNVFVHTTYLDPVSIYGGIDWSYGTRNFGSCANISDAYIDHEDGVPGSDEPLEHPHTFDVTALKKGANYSGSPHLWPVEYYRRTVLSNELPYWVPDKHTLQQYPPYRSTVM
jgi:hypothetical protein